MLSCLDDFRSLEPEDIINEILEDKTEPSYFCLNCDELAKATCHCKNCNELLCNKCLRAHTRVKLTKDHYIIPLEDPYLSSESSYSSSSVATSQSSPKTILYGNCIGICDLHFSESSRMYCDDCCLVFCYDCNSMEHKSHHQIFIQEAIDYARNSSLKIIAEAKLNAQEANECLSISQRMLDTLNLKSQSVKREIRNIMHCFQVAIEERERELIYKVEKIRLLKHKAIHQQVEGYRNLVSCFSQTSQILSDCLEVAGPLDILQLAESISAEMKRLQSIRDSMPHADDHMSLIPPDCSLLFAINSMAEISTSSHTSGTINGKIIRSFCQNHKQTKATSLLSDISNIFHHISPIINDISQTKKSVFSVTNDISTITNTIAPITYTSTSIANSISPTNNSFLPINNIISPITNQEKQFQILSKFPFLTSGNYREVSNPLISVPKNTLGTLWRDYRLVKGPTLIIGGEGEKDGQLCRPWGVCCTPEGKIVVADRSNNRIQIFKANGSFLYKFGSHGAEPGCFDRPAGVAIDPLGRIVVTDKDNHRVQMFTQEGIFIFTFGEKGSKAGQFNYPWDLAIDANGRIVISDTRNHRIQLFDNNGNFLAKYGFECSTNMVKHFDSPRGVCFGAKGFVIVTDFNNHRLVVIDPTFRNAKFLGSEGCGEKQFLRPQGIAVDPLGNIIVADSRNNRIQIFEQNGCYLSEFGSVGKEPGQMDRPSGICLSPGGKIIVVDFGNNRVQVF